MSLTLTQMSDFVTKKVGQFDPASVILCKSYLAARYRMIWDSYLWRDSTIYSAITISAATVAYPTGLERAITLRLGDHFLDPIDESFLIETDPLIFERTGIPLYYSEQQTAVTHSPDAGVPSVAAKGIRVYPTPDQSYTLLIYGKRVCPELTDASSTSALRNCDNAIMAFATGDMLERARQYAKAQAKFQEAAAHLESAKALEQQQANKPRRSKNLTVAGNSLSEMTDAVCGICGQWTPDIRISVREFLRRNYQTLYDLKLWPESTVAVNMQFISEQVILPDYVDRVIGVRGGDMTMIAPVEQSLYLGIDPTMYEQTGSPIGFSYLTPVGVATLPPMAPEQLQFASTSSSDVSTVFVRGETYGLEKTEEVTLDGTNLVKTVNLYDVPITVSKGITYGDVTVNGAVSAASLLVLKAAEREKKHIRLWILPVPDSVLLADDTRNRVLILGKRRITPLISDEDTPIITNCQNVLINAAAADMFMKLGQESQAKAMQAKAGEATQILVGLNTQQAAHQPRIIPDVEGSSLELETLCWSKP